MILNKEKLPTKLIILTDLPFCQATKILCTKVNMLMVALLYSAKIWQWKSLMNWQIASDLSKIFLPKPFSLNASPMKPVCQRSVACHSFVYASFFKDFSCQTFMLYGIIASTINKWKSMLTFLDWKAPFSALL